MGTLVDGEYFPVKVPADSLGQNARLQRLLPISLASRAFSTLGKALGSDHHGLGPVLHGLVRAQGRSPQLYVSASVSK